MVVSVFTLKKEKHIWMELIAVNLEDWQAITCLPGIILAFVFHYNVFPVYRELINPTNQRFKKSALLGLTICLVIYLVSAIASYITFGDATQASVLDNYSEEKTAISTVLAICFAINIFFTIPMAFFEFRNNILLIAEDLKELRGGLASPELNATTPTPAEFKKRDQRIY